MVASFDILGIIPGKPVDLPRTMRPVALCVELLLVVFGFSQNFGGRGVVGTYELLFCSKINAASVVLTMLGDEDSQTLLDGKKHFELYALTGSGYPKTFPLSLAPQC